MFCGDKDKGAGKCYKCGKEGHIAAGCDGPSSTKVSVASNLNAIYVY